MKTPYRVAFFTDSFHEVNGVALTSREFVGFARRRSIPLLSVHAGPAVRTSYQGSVCTFEFDRGPVRWALERDLAIDLLFLRHRFTDTFGNVVLEAIGVWCSRPRSIGRRP